MATEILIVQIIQFFCTKQCMADPSLFEAVRNIVQHWLDRGLKAQYWGTAAAKPNNVYWILLWQSRAHADAFVEDPLYLEFVERRLSLAINPVCDFRVSLSGVEHFVLAPYTQVLIYKTPDTGILEEVHEAARDVINIIRSLQPPGFHGSTYGITLDDPTLGVYIAGWRSVEDHMCLGMAEGHENYRETAEGLMSRLTDLMFSHVALKKHGA
ncbi:hypothetical protein V8E53_013360 [Lactarius tabidus]